MVGQLGRVEISSQNDMSEKQIIDMKHWNRREHFEWFNSFEEPNAGITANVDVRRAYDVAKAKGYKFSLFYFYLSLCAANSVESMRYRIEHGEVVCYDSIGGDTTIFRDDMTYGCTHFDFHSDYPSFEKAALLCMESVRSREGLCNDYVGLDTIYYSTVPWIHFTAVNHPRKGGVNAGVPRITFGKIIKDGESLLLPLDLHFHHALMDGYHAGKFFELFQRLLDDAGRSEERRVGKACRLMCRCRWSRYLWKGSYLLL